jgi:hypothetical protein
MENQFQDLSKLETKVFLTLNIPSVMTRIKKPRLSLRKIERRKWKIELMESKNKQKIQRLLRTKNQILKQLRKIQKQRMEVPL